MKYVIGIQELLSRKVIINAENYVEALHKAEELYTNGIIVIGDRDYSDVVFNFCGNATNADIKNYEEEY